MHAAQTVRSNFIKCLFTKECMLDVKYEIKVNISCEIMQKVSKKDKELSAESLLTYICTCIYVLFIKFTKHSLGNPNVFFYVNMVQEYFN